MINIINKEVNFSGLVSLFCKSCKTNVKINKPKFIRYVSNGNSNAIIKIYICNNCGKMIVT